MKKIILSLFITLLTLNVSIAQYPSGQIVVKRLYSKNLENTGGENPTRRVTIYLPPGYEGSDKRYPVIYFLHGFTISDSLMIAWAHFDQLLNKAIATNKIRPVIVVMPDEYTLYRGSWYTNSSLTGKWADFTGKDLVAFTDKNFRTIHNREGRGVAGHSMGGQGAIKMGMLFPEVFSTVYAMSPATLDIMEEFGLQGKAYYKRVKEIASREQLTAGWKEFYPNAIVAMGRAYTPNVDKPPYYADFPYEYSDDSLIINYEVFNIWKQKSVMGMVDKHIKDLKKLKALKIDWGRNEDNPHIPPTCLQFSKMLENLGINHYAEEYIGTHTNKLWTDDGRALNDMVPFFNTYLTFDE